MANKAPNIKNYIRGDSRVISVQYYQPDGITPADLTGCEVFFTLNLDDTPPDDGSDNTASIRLSTTNFDPATPGVASFTLTNALTQPLVAGDYFYDVQLRDANGNITSSPQGTFTVVDDITTRIT